MTEKHIQTEIVKNVRSFGAVGNGNEIDTSAIQQAIDACHLDGGGEVYFPAGTYLIGTIQLRSKVTLNLGQGSILLALAPSNPDAYSYDWKETDYSKGFLDKMELTPLQSLIYAEDVNNAGIVGAGTIDGGWTGVLTKAEDGLKYKRPMLFRFVNCSNVLMRDVTLTRPASFVTYWEHCIDIRIEGVTIRSQATGNGDGLDFNGCENVIISGCNLDCGDDAISLKPLRPGNPSCRFIISNCIIRSKWAAIRLGPETHGGMHDIVVSNCVFFDCRDGIKIQNTEGAVMENMLFSNIVMRDVNRPFFITLNRWYGFSRYIDEDFECGILRDIRCVNIRAVSRQPASDNLHDMPCIAIVGLPGYLIEGVSFSDVHITMPGGGTKADTMRVDIPELTDSTELWPEAIHFEGPLPCSSLYLRHVRQVSMTNVRLSLAKADERSFIGGNDAHDIILDGLSVNAPGPVADLCNLRESSHITIRNTSENCFGGKKNE